MSSLKFTSMSLVVLALAGSTAFAATTSMSSKPKMAPSEVKTMKACQAMKQGAMMKNKNCMALQKKYPGVLKQASSTSSGTMKTNATTGGTMKTNSMSGGMKSGSSKAK